MPQVSANNALNQEVLWHFALMTIYLQDKMPQYTSKLQYLEVYCGIHF